MEREPLGQAGSHVTDLGLAHDLRNLLTAIDGHARLAQAALPDKHPARDDIDEVLAAASRAHQLTEAWLAGPRAVVPPAVPMPLDDLVNGFLPLLAAVIGPGVAVDVRLDAPVVVRISRLRLERVLLNLCLNARDAMPDGGRLTIAAAPRADGRVEVAIRDTGPGVDLALIARLFDSGSRPLPGPDGHGLGLVTSRALLMEAGGSLEVESQPGAGTTTRAVLPPG